MKRLMAKVALAVALLSLVASPAAAETQLVCNRLYGGYSLYPLGNSSSYPWVNAYQHPTGTWSGWKNTHQLKLTGFSLPTRGEVAIYLYYARWNGAAWEYAAEWAYVTNARGQRVGYYC